MSRKYYEKMANNRYSFICMEGFEHICVYCGMLADSVDHIIPISILGKLSNLSNEIESNTIPCCRECNYLAGSSFFQSFADKKTYVNGQIRAKYYKTLRIPEWSKEELKDVGPNARTDICAFIRKKQIILERLEYVSPLEHILNNGVSFVKLVFDKKENKIKIKNDNLKSFSDKLTIGCTSKSIAEWCIEKNITAGRLPKIIKKFSSIEELIKQIGSANQISKNQIKRLNAKKECFSKIVGSANIPIQEINPDNHIL